MIVSMSKRLNKTKKGYMCIMTTRVRIRTTIAIFCLRTGGCEDHGHDHDGSQEHGPSFRTPEKRHEMLRCVYSSFDFRISCSVSLGVCRPVPTIWKTLNA
jgi:hypothetical protein